jgi:hypothetical protein
MIVSTSLLFNFLQRCGTKSTGREVSYVVKNGGRGDSHELWKLENAPGSHTDAGCGPVWEVLHFHPGRLASWRSEAEAQAESFLVSSLGFIGPGSRL